MLPAPVVVSVLPSMEPGPDITEKETGKPESAPGAERDRTGPQGGGIGDLHERNRLAGCRYREPAIDEIDAVIGRPEAARRNGVRAGRAVRGCRCREGERPAETGRRVSVDQAVVAGCECRVGLADAFRLIVRRHHERRRQYQHRPADESNRIIRRSDATDRDGVVPGELSADSKEEKARTPLRLAALSPLTKPEKLAVKVESAAP